MSRGRQGKKTTMENYWVPGVNNLKTYGRWSFAEFCDIYQIGADFATKVEKHFNDMVSKVASIDETAMATVQGGK